MPTNSVLLNEMKKIFEEHGGEAFDKAKYEIAVASKSNSKLSQALSHFSSVSLRNALPVFPALVSISCEAVGGDAEMSIPFGKALVLIATAADLHDDIIDQSFSKGSKRTVFGKFGLSDTILAGDMLLTRGLILLNEASSSIQNQKADSIIKHAADAIFELCIAESLEVQLRNAGIKIRPKKYLEIIRLKAGFPEANMKIGAILGSDNSESVEILGEFGRTFGFVSAVADEFSDLLNRDELANRLKNECPPLPLIYALQNAKTRNGVTILLGESLHNKEVYEKIVNFGLCSSGSKKLVEMLKAAGKIEIKKIEKVIKGKSREELQTILSAPLEFLDGACSP